MKTTLNIRMSMSQRRRVFSIRAVLLAAVSLSILQLALCQNTGINTDTPLRQLHVQGEDDQFLRVQTGTIGADVGLELMNSSILAAMEDWRIRNSDDGLRIDRSQDDFNSMNSTIVRLAPNGNVGINAMDADAPLHIQGGGQPLDDGLLMIGHKGGLNTMFDGNEIGARLNGSPYTLYFQQNGGGTDISSNGASVLMGHLSDNQLGIGTTFPQARLSIDGTNFHMRIHNDEGTTNEWHIGASNADWGVGDNQLIFSPSGLSTASHFRLRAVSENNGSQAPVTIRSAGAQTMLLDGNEIDGLSDAIWINHNSDQNTYINPLGGNVAVGAASAPTTLLVETDASEYTLRLENTSNSNSWSIHPYPAINKLAFVKNGSTLAQVDGSSGAWIALSDKRMKEDIVELEDVLDKILKLDLYSYHFKHDNTGKRQLGALAQDLQKLFPELVSENEGYLTVADELLAVVALKALQEQQTEIDKLTEEIESYIKYRK